MIQFNSIPQSNLRVPLFYAEINKAQSPYVSISRLLLLGQKMSDGGAEAGVPVHVQGDPRALFGRRSMLNDMVAKARMNAPIQEIWALPMDDLEAGVAATGKITIDVDAFPVSAAATVSVWIGEWQVRTIVYTTDTAAVLATRLAAAINATEPCPVTAAVNGVNNYEVDLTARQKGTPGNTLHIDTDYYGTDGPLAARLFSFTQMSGGTGDPDFTAALATLGDDEFDWIVGPYADGVNLGAIGNLLQGQSGRWSPFKQLYGHYLAVKRDTVSNLLTFGPTYNDPHLSVFGINKAASPSWCWAGALGGRMAAHLTEPPELSRPLQTLDLIGILPPKSAKDRPDQTDRQSLYWAGISSYHVDGKTKTASIDRIITTYRLNEWGSPDASWLDVNTLAQSQYAIRAIRAAVTGQWGRAALMDTNPEGLQGVATVEDIRATIVHEYKRLHRLGVVDNPGLFEQMLIVERNAVDANRVDVYLPADHVNQLRIVAVNYVSHLQYQQAA